MRKAPDISKVQLIGMLSFSVRVSEYILMEGEMKVGAHKPGVLHERLVEALGSVPYHTRRDFPGHINKIHIFTIKNRTGFRMTTHKLASAKKEFVHKCNKSFNLGKV